MQAFLQFAMKPSAHVIVEFGQVTPAHGSLGDEPPEEPPDEPPPPDDVVFVVFCVC